MLFQWRHLVKNSDRMEFQSIVVTATSTEEARVIAEKVAREHRVWRHFKKVLSHEPQTCVPDDQGLMIYGD